MKKFLAITTSLCAAVCALGLGGTFAFAETDTDGAADNSQYYPKNFETVPSFTNLEDYAVGDGKILFLQNNVIYEYGSANVIPYENSSKKITGLYFEGEEFYYETNDGKLYALKNFNQEDKIEDFTLTNPSSVELGTYYYFKNNGAYYFIDQSADAPRSLLEGFSNLKLYGKGENQKVYGVKENVLYTLNGAAHTAVTVENFDVTKEIQVGNAPEKLALSADNDPKFVHLAKDAYMTEVDLDDLDSSTENAEFFSTGDTVKVNTGETPTALLLHKAGNNEAGIAVIAVNGKAYLIHPKDVTDKTVYPFKDSKFSKGTATEGYIYSAPYESKGTRIRPLPYGTSVNILKEIKMADNAELNHDYYYVEYQVDEATTVKGYVRFGLLSTYTFNEDDPQKTPDPEETYDDLVKPVVLILIVLLLIAIAAGYLIYVGTSDKRNKKNEAAATDTTKQDKR